MTKLATVISVRGRNRDELLADPDFVYVGRAVRHTAWADSKWGNPFKRGQDPFQAMRILAKVPGKAMAIEFDGPLTTAKAVECFACHLESLKAHFGPTWDQNISELQGKTLGCWCGHWEPGQPEIACHAVVLAKAVNALTKQEAR